MDLSIWVMIVLLRGRLLLGMIVRYYSALFLYAHSLRNRLRNRLRNNSALVLFLPRSIVVIVIVDMKLWGDRTDLLIGHMRDGSKFLFNHQRLFLFWFMFLSGYIRSGHFNIMDEVDMSRSSLVVLRSCRSLNMSWRIYWNSLGLVVDWLVDWKFWCLVRCRSGVNLHSYLVAGYLCQIDRDLFFYWLHI